MGKDFWGTAQRCERHDNCGELMAVAYPELGKVEIKDRRHGTPHSLALGLVELVNILDPQGTTFVPKAGTA